MNNELIERLREQAVSWDGFGKPLPPKELETKAADRIEALEAALRGLYDDGVIPDAWLDSNGKQHRELIEGLTMTARRNDGED